MVHAIRTRVCAFFIGLVVLIVSVVGGVEMQAKMFDVILDGLAENELFQLLKAIGSRRLCAALFPGLLVSALIGPLLTLLIGQAWKP